MSNYFSLSGLSWGGTGMASMATGVYTPPAKSASSNADSWHVNTSTSPLPSTPNQHTLMGTIVSDIKNFIKEHRAMIYGSVVILLIDHFFLGGKLKEKVRSMAEKLLGSVEKRIDAAGEPAKVAVATPTVTTT